MAAERLGFATLWAPEHVVLVEQYASKYPYTSGQFPGPPDIPIAVKDQTQILIAGVDKQKVGAIAATLRGFRPPEPYKGKGVLYAGEVIRRKAGKTGA